VVKVSGGSTLVTAATSLEVSSKDYNAKVSGKKSYFRIGTRVLDSPLRGLTVISLAMGAQWRTFIKESFDSYASSAVANAALATFMNAVPTGRVVMASVSDEASGINSTLLKSVGGSGTSLQHREGFALIGKKGAAPGTAQEKFGRTCSSGCVRLQNSPTLQSSCTCTPAVATSGANYTAAKNLAACTGECDSDADCATGLKCFQRDNGEPIPGCDVSTAPGGDWDCTSCETPPLPLAPTRLLHLHAQLLHRAQTATTPEPTTARALPAPPALQALSQRRRVHALLAPPALQARTKMPVARPRASSALRASTAPLWQRRAQKMSRVQHARWASHRPPPARLHALIVQQACTSPQAARCRAPRALQARTSPPAARFRA
jgi:hypothetical protein